MGLAGDSPERTDHALLDGFRLMRQSIPQMQAMGVGVDAIASVLAAAPGIGGSTFGATLHPDGISSMAGSLLAVDATVLDPVLEGTIGTFLDPETPFGVPSLIVCADPAVPGAVADPAIAEYYADISHATEVLVVEGAGHLIHDELASRDRFREAALDFLDRLGPSSET